MGDGSRTAELQYGYRPNYSLQVADLRDGGTDDEADGPIYGDDGNPYQFTSPRPQMRKTKHVHQDMIVDDLDTDIAIEHSRDDGRDKLERSALFI